MSFASHILYQSIKQILTAFDNIHTYPAYTYLDVFWVIVKCLPIEFCSCTKSSKKVESVRHIGNESSCEKTSVSGNILLIEPS